MSKDTFDISRRMALVAPLAAATMASTSAGAQQVTIAPGQPILIRGARLLTMDPALGEMASGDVLVVDGSIRAIAPRIDGPADAAVLDGVGRVALPGFVNGHVHLAQTMQRGLSTDHAFGAYFQTIVLRHSNRMTPDDVRLADRAGALGEIAAGVTTVMDWSRETLSPDHADAALEGLAASGIRAVLAYTTPTIPQGGDAGATNSRMMAHARALLGGRLPGNGLLTLWTCLQGPDFVPLEPALADMRRLSELGAPIAIHTGAAIYANRKPRLLAQLDAAGLLNERLQIVHANGHDDDEYRLAGERGVMLASTPEVEMRMGHGQPAIFKAQAAGMRVSFGTDIPSMVGGGILPQARIAMAAELARRNALAIASGQPVANPPSITTRQVLAMATSEGARGLRLDRMTGTLSIGKRADILLVRSDQPLTAPLSDAAGAVLHQASAGEIETVMIDGVLRKQDGRLTDPAAADILRRVQARAEEMAEAARRG